MKNDKHTSAIPEAVITQVCGQISAALAFYHNVQAAAKDDIPGGKGNRRGLENPVPRR
jgi:hypothetical protein